MKFNVLFYIGVPRYGDDLSVSAFLCHCTTPGCDPDTGECTNGGVCSDGPPYGKGFTWRGEDCQIGNKTEKCFTKHLNYS